MRIALIAPPWLPVPPPAYGGTEAVLDVLARGLRAAGHDVLLYATGDSTGPVPTAWSHPLALGTDVGLAAVAFELAHVLDAYDCVRGADIVHDHTLVGPVHGAHLAGTTVVTTHHGPFDGPATTIFRHVARRVPVVAISAHQASTARSVPIAAVIHHGLDVDAFPVGRGDGGYALFLGRMSEEKGVDVAIRVARAAGVPLRIAAKLRDEHEHAYFAERVEPLLGGDVEYVGEVDAAGKLELLLGAVCLLNPIQWPEPFGMVMIEALATGTPIVGTPRGAAPEIVDEGVTGSLRDHEEALVVALRDAPSLDRSACRRAAEERFSSARLAADHIRLYEQLLAR